MNTRIYIMIFILLGYYHTQAAPVLDSIKTLSSTCRDNGRITVYAHGTGALHYSIVSGPVQRPAQLSNTFAALPGGTYRLQISDSSGNLFQTSTVTGGYHYFDFSPEAIYPLCLRGGDILLIGHPDSNATSTPLSWQLTDPGGQISLSQQSDTYHITTSGQYMIRCADACGTVRQRYFTIDGVGHSNLALHYIGNNLRPACDSLMVYAEYGIIGGLSRLSFPLSFIEYNDHGDTIRQDFPVNPGPMLYWMSNGYIRLYGSLILVQNVMGNVYEGDSVHFGLIDACGDTVMSAVRAFVPSITMNGWYNQIGPSCSYVSMPLLAYDLPMPSQWILIDNNLHAIADSSSTGLGLTPHTPGSSYTFICYDQCGDTLRQQFIWQQPVLGAPAVSEIIGQSSCMDSTASVTLYLNNFLGPTQIKILSGPAYAQSSKPGFAYRTHITYPYILNQNIANSVTTLSAFPPGYYTYQVDDSCGNHISGTFNVGTDQVTNFTHHLTAHRNCPGGNSILYQYGTGQSLDNLSIYYSAYNLTTGQPVDSSYTSGNGGMATLNNLTPGSYMMRLEIQSWSTTITDTVQCAIVYDTVVIPPYTFPDIPVVSYSPSCTGYATISAEMDTALGVPGFTYQIIAGPELSPVQYGTGTFPVSHTGVYTILGLDQCGNGLVRNVSVDSLYLSISTIRTTTDSCFRMHVRGTLYTESTVVVDTLRTAAGCDSTILIDTIIIRGSRDSRPVVAITADTFCAGAGGYISAAQGYQIYQWDNGDTTRIIHVRDSGWYHVTVTDTERCMLSDQIHISLIDSPSIASGWVYEDSVCLDDPLSIRLTLSGPDVIYKWMDITEASLQRQFADSGTYIFTISNECASKSYTLRTIEKTCEEHAYPPNAFSPNGDGVNDIYRVYSSYDFSSFNLLIFDRWGEKVFESHNEAVGWDGRYKTEDLPAGVYAYEYIGVWPTGHTHTSRGSITLIR